MLKKHFSIFIFILFGSTFLVSQNSRLHNAYIPSNGFISIFNKHTFHNDIIYTNRGSNPGHVNFVNKATWVGANENSYVDGFVKVHHDNFFTFPIGDMGLYKPISISGAAGTSAAYFLGNVNNNIDVVTSLEDEDKTGSKNLVPSQNEYWVMKGDKPTQIILHWDENSELSKLSSDLSDINLLGWNGINWEIIKTEISEFALDVNSSNRSASNIKSSVNKGSLISDFIIPNEYSILTFGTNSEKSSLLNDMEESENTLSNEEVIEMTIFPNPINNLNNVKIDYKFSNIDSKAFVVVFDHAGNFLFKQEISGEKGIYSLPLDEEMNQMYSIGIITDSGSKRFESVMVGSR